MKRLITIYCTAICILLVGSVLATEGGLMPSDSGRVGRSVADFLTPDGRFDLNAVRTSGYQGPLDLNRVDVRVDPRSGAPMAIPSAAQSPADDPDDVFWDNSISPSISGIDGPVWALTVYDGRLIAGGWLTMAGGVAANKIASWDRNSWSPLGSGIGKDYSCVYALTVYDGKLIAGGGFTTAGGADANSIASWDGSSWSPLGSGMNVDGYVWALAVYDGKLIAGGFFTTAGGVATYSIASWDGSNWSPLGLGMGGLTHPSVSALTMYDGKLIAGGVFYLAGGVAANNIASWDGSSWSPLGSGTSSEVCALAVYDGKLIAGGDFTWASGVLANYIASWDGSSWSSLGSGMAGGTVRRVFALSVYDGTLIAGGEFAWAGDVATIGIASWDGSSWSPLGSGMNNWVFALTTYDRELIAGGGFTIAGNKASAYLAAWTKHDPYSGPVWHVSTVGNDITGDGSEPHPFATIQHGIDAAMTGDTVLVALGTYTGDGNRDIDFEGRNIVLKSANGPEATIVDVQASASDRHRGFRFHSGESNAARIEGFTITNGYAPKDDTVVIDIDTLVFAYGGAVFCDSGSSPTVRGCVMSNNHARMGTGSGGDGGGGVYCYKANPVIEDNVIRGNTSGNGGGMVLARSNAKVIRNLIIENTASYEAGGIAILGSADTLVANTISANSAAIGGGVWLRISSPTFERCNIAFNNGGSFVCSGADNLPVLTCSNIYHSGQPGWAGCISGQLGQNGNISVDPMFCDTANDDYHISSNSPCAPANNNCGVLIGALEVTCNTTDVEDGNVNMPTSFSLKQNYPNPFNPTTTIEYSVPALTHVTVKILNILGQSIRTLVDENKAAGTYRVEWSGTANDGNSVSSGIYLYRIKAGEFVESRKMLLLK